MREYNANERKLLKWSNSRWFTWGMALFWAIVALSDYHRHQLSYIDCLLVGSWCLLALAELVMAGVYRRKKDATG
jgi:hypothetical protein